MHIQQSRLLSATRWRAGSVLSFATRGVRSALHALAARGGAAAREPAEGLMALDVDVRGLALHPRLRIAAFIALMAAALFLPLELRRSHYSPSLLAIFAIHLAIASFVLVASYTNLGRRHAGGLAGLLVGGHALNSNLYFYFYPRDPGLTADALTCIMIGSSVIFFWSTRRVLVLCAAVCLVFALVGFTIPEEVRRGPFPVALAALVVGAAIAAASAHVLGRLRSTLARRQSELGALSARVMSVQEEERRRLSRELHDELGQSLTAVNAYLWLIERQLPDDLTKLRKRAAEARQVIGRTFGSIRELAQLLRPQALDDFGLVPSLDTHLRAFSERHQIAASFRAEGLPERLPPEIETAVYRITQEALTNVARHAQAKRVRVLLARDEGDLRLDIEDDGIGLQPPKGSGWKPGTGLIGIRERARALGGTVTIRSGAGARLRVRLPLPSLDSPSSGTPPADPAGA